MTPPDVGMKPVEEEDLVAGRELGDVPFLSNLKACFILQNLFCINVNITQVVDDMAAT